MKKIAIYVEGGGDSKDQKAELRNGFDVLFGVQKKAAQAKRLGWKLVPSGGRDQTYAAFINEFNQADAETLCILLVDSEDAIAPEVANQDDANACTRKQHLVNRDGWNLATVSPNQIHLMVRCMEAWVVADPDALTRFYGQGFRANSLPQRINLEDEPKADVYTKLATATKNTQKGEYGKIKHAAKLLALIASVKVSGRCARFKTFTTWLTKQIEAA